MMRVLSLGAGVQSTTLALMAAQGEITPLPECAVFADTGWEPERVYEHLDWLERVLPFEVVRAKRPGPDLGEMAMAIATTAGLTRTALPPWYTKDPDGMLPQQCSKEFKTRVVARVVRERLGIGRVHRGGPLADLWIGISRDEADRMKAAESGFLQHRYPLIEAGISRRECLAWLDRRGYPQPPKSACIFCPWTDSERWRERKQQNGIDWHRAVAFDAAIRAGYVGMPGTAYVHRQRVALAEVDLSSVHDGQLDLFGNECEGMCGV